jgi:branched-chain amino acid aminotransferase
LIAVRNGVLHAPPLTASILDSITRRFVIGLARELGFEVLEADMTPYQLLMAEEVFLCGTMGELTPVRSINDQQVGDEVPGPITRQLLEAYAERRKNPKYGTTIA